MPTVPLSSWCPRNLSPRIWADLGYIPAAIRYEHHDARLYVHVYTDGQPASPVIVTGWVRAGHPADEITRLATEIASAVTWIAGITAERVLVVIQSSPARFAVESGRVRPEPGQEQSWTNGFVDCGGSSQCQPVAGWINNTSRNLPI